MSCISHAVLLCVNEGFAPLEALTDPPPYLCSLLGTLLVPYWPHMMLLVGCEMTTTVLLFTSAEKKRKKVFSLKCVKCFFRETQLKTGPLLALYYNVFHASSTVAEL